MNEDMLSEIQELLEFQKKSGFYSDEEVLENVTEYLEDNYETEEWPDEGWILSEIHRLDQVIDKHTEQLYFKRLDNAFNELTKKKIIALHKAGYTISDGFEDANEIAADMHEKGNTPIGCCFYHEQDLERIIDTDSQKLYLAFGSYTHEVSGVKVGEMVVAVLQEAGFKVEWDHDEESRIAITNMIWDKVYEA